MADANEGRLRIVQRAEKDLQAYVKVKGSTFSEIIQSLAQYRSACEGLILQDFEFSVSKDIESKLWDSHGQINNIFRKELKHFTEAAGKKNPVELRKTAKHYVNFIKSSQRFYRGYIQRLACRFNGVLELEAVADRLTLSTLSVDDPAHVDGLFGHSILFSCHQTLVRLGDLSRWRETQLVTKDRNWGPAIGYYDLARIIYPVSGASHNQLAVIALVDANHLRATYHLYRALAIEEPHPSARGNLEIEFKKIREVLDREDSINHDDERGVQGPKEALVRWFMCLHARCYEGVETPAHEELESKVLQHLAVDLKERSLEGTFSKIVLVNIAAEYFAGVRLKGDPGSVEIVQSFFFLLRVNVKTLFTLLQILLPELERSDAENLQASGTESGSGKLTAVTRRVLPALRNYSSWLIINATILAAGVGDTLLAVQIKELWKIYANALTLLVSTFPVSGLPPPVEYLLEEDEDTLGFKPFMNEITQRRYFGEDTGFQKPKWHDRGVHRHHPNLEMLGRIRDLLTDGMVLHAQEEIPIQLVGTTFVYIEDGIPSVASQQVLPSLSANHEEVTHVDETTLPHMASSVNVEGSPAALASISMDPASKRMVDDLVDSENADDDDEIPSQSGLGLSSAHEAGNETSYGLFGSATARALEALEDPPPPTPRSLLPSIYNSPFAPRPDEDTTVSRPGTAKRRTPSHSQQHSQTNLAFQQPVDVYNIESSTTSSMPEPTNRSLPITSGYLNQPLLNATFSVPTNHTTGGRPSTTYQNDGHSTMFDYSFRSSAQDFGGSGSVKGVTNVQTPPNGQGAD